MLLLTLHSSENKRFALNEMFHRNTSKFALYFMYRYLKENPPSFFILQFVQLYFSPYECPGICQHRPG